MPKSKPEATSIEFEPKHRKVELFCIIHAVADMEF